MISSPPEPTGHTELDAAIYAIGVVSTCASSVDEFEDYVFGPGGDPCAIDSFDTTSYDCKVGFPAPPPSIDDERVSRALRQVTSDVLGVAGVHRRRQRPEPDVAFLVGCVDQMLTGTFENVTKELLEWDAGSIAVGTCSSFMPAAVALARRRAEGLPLLASNEASPAEQLLDGSPLTPPAVLQSYLGLACDWSKLSFCNTACSSSLEAIGRAAIAVSSGLTPWALAGGVEVLNEVLHAGFDMSQVLTNSLCRPFSRVRRGFQLGEGAGLALIAPPSRFGEGYLARITGVGAGLDGYHLTAPDPQGAGLRLALGQALADPAEVGGVVAHGTGTQRNDGVESEVYREVLGASRAAGLPVTSVKSRLGHSLGAAGVHSVVSAVLALRRGEMPGTRNLTDSIVGAPLTASSAPQVLEGTAVLVAVAAFGGHNAVVVLER